MARYLGSVCKLCRREKDKLFLKGQRCNTKCTLDSKRGKNAPGQSGSARMKKMSEYAVRLREKQKARRVYGLTEQQFHHYFVRAEKMKGMTGDNLLQLLELRLDNVVYRLGLTSSRSMARQMVNHGNILVNGKRIDLPGYHVHADDKISLSNRIKENALVKKSLEHAGKSPSWLKLDRENIVGSIVAMPQHDEFSHPINSQLIVELYSK